MALLDGFLRGERELEIKIKFPRQDIESARTIDGFLQQKKRHQAERLLRHTYNFPTK